MARQRRAPYPQDWTPQQQLKLTLAMAVSLILGLGFTVAPIAFRATDVAKRTRLAVEGVPVTATVGGFDWGVRGPSTVDVEYQHDGRRYRASIICVDHAGCAGGRPAPTMQIRVDADEPGEFAAANGHTDDSRALFNHLGWLSWGFVGLALGGFLCWVRLTVDGVGPPRRPTKR